MKTTLVFTQEGDYKQTLEISESEIKEGIDIVIVGDALKITLLFSLDTSQTKLLALALTQITKSQL